MTGSGQRGEFVAADVAGIGVDDVAGTVVAASHTAFAEIACCVVVVAVAVAVAAASE